MPVLSKSTLLKWDIKVNLFVPSLKRKSKSEVFSISSLSNLSIIILISNFRPMKRFTEKTVFSALTIAWWLKLRTMVSVTLAQGAIPVSWRTSFTEPPAISAGVGT